MEKLKYLIKYSPIIYSIYYYVLSALFRVLGLFVKIDKQLIIFNSFGGRKYDDSPKAIFEYMLQDDRFKDYKFVWGLNEPNKFDIPSRAIVVNVNSLKYFIYALKAKIWITNSSIERGLCFKKKDTIYINTWHGTAIKHLGNDIGEQNKSFKGKVSKVDIFFSQGSYDEKVFKSAFCRTNEDLFRFGLPRNDELANCDYETSTAIKKKLNIPLEKKIILYAPTFREYTKNKSNQVMLNVPINFETWQETLGENIVILFRAHYEVAKLLNVLNYDFVYDVSKYPSLNELMIISDVLISDYSSIFFDFSILHKPMLCYAYDYDLYTEKRGMYIDLKKELPCKVCETETELLNEISNVFDNYNLNCIATKKFQEKYIEEYGNASRKICDYLIKYLT